MDDNGTSPWRQSASGADETAEEGCWKQEKHEDAVEGKRNAYALALKRRRPVLQNSSPASKRLLRGSFGTVELLACIERGSACTVELLLASAAIGNGSSRRTTSCSSRQSAMR